MEIEIEAKKDIFNRNVEQLDVSNLTKLMTCELCKGLLRLAHTLMECGHTFCKMCLLDYIARFKGKKSAPKCPICQFSIDPNHKKSIFRDTYKQDIVDLLVPESKEKDIGIVKKSIQLFP
jgi:E3 ubiquitin-protein ligase DRIP